MNEIFWNELSLLRFYTFFRGEAIIPSTTPTAKLYVSATEEFDQAPEDLTVSAILEGSTPTGEYRVIVPQASVVGKRFAKVVYSYDLPGVGQVEKVEAFEIETRLFSYEEYVYGTSDTFSQVLFDEYTVAESSARKVIESYCNQKFSVWTGSQDVYGNPNNLFLPQHMRKVIKVRDSAGTELPEYRLDPTGLFLSGTTVNKLAGNKWFSVEADWGYSVIPDVIRQSAFELTRDFSTSVINDRRYYRLNTGGGGISGAMEQQSDLISWQAYRDSTGNFIVDGWLKDFRIFNLGIL